MERTSDHSFYKLSSGCLVEYTPEDDPNDKLDNPFFNGITVRPQPFGPGVETYSVLFRFRELASDVFAGKGSRGGPHARRRWRYRRGRVRPMPVARRGVDKVGAGIVISTG